MLENLQACLSRNCWSVLEYDLMTSICEKAVSILAGNLNSGCSYLITAVPMELKKNSFLRK